MRSDRVLIPLLDDQGGESMGIRKAFEYSRQVYAR